jgi:hypothetical protein
MLYRTFNYRNYDRAGASWENESVDNGTGADGHLRPHSLCPVAGVSCNSLGWHNKWRIIYFFKHATPNPISTSTSFRLSVVGNISISRIEISFEPELIDSTGTDLVFYPLRRLQKSFVKP